MAEAAKIPSTSMVSYYLEILAEEGEIELPQNGEARLIRVVGAEWRPPGG